MKLQMIGTGAGEGYPGLWCDCNNCRSAREKGGKNLRGNCTALLDGELLLDMNPHFFEMAPQLGIHPSNIRYLLVTHPHEDHFTPWLLSQRAADLSAANMHGDELLSRVAPCFTSLPLLTVYGSEHVEKALHAVPGLMEKAEQCRFAFRRITAGQDFYAGAYRITPIDSIHGAVPGYTQNYMLRKDGKTLLYATDTGGYTAQALPLVLSHRYDLVVLEGTFGLGADVPGHMNLQKDRQFRNLLLQHGCIHSDTPVYLTHICPHWAPPHDEYIKIIQGYGMHLAYDGEEISF